MAGRTWEGNERERGKTTLAHSLVTNHDRKVTHIIGYVHRCGLGKKGDTSTHLCFPFISAFLFSFVRNPFLGAAVLIPWAAEE